MGCSCSKIIQAETIKSKVKTIVDSVNISASTFLSRTKGKLSTNYAVLKKIGSGAFAEVQLCVYKPLNQHRAVKMIHKSGLTQQQIDEDYMLQEIAVLTKLDHPNILKCYEIFEDNWNFYIAMDYCEGGELFDMLVKRKRLNESEAAQIISQILSALAYCHERHVIHRDLKPENILLEESSQSFYIKIADFGSSCFIDKTKKLSGCFGSAYYVAPEVLNGSYDKKCDVWSVGVIMFVMLTGRPPYKGSDEQVILDQVRNSPLSIDQQAFPFLSPASIDILQKLLIVEPKSRISSKQALLHPWMQTSRESASAPDISTSLSHLSVFSSSSKLKDSVHLFLASQAISHDELKALRLEFESIDKNKDGTLSKAELIEQYRKTMDKDEAADTVEKIMRRLDVNHNGNIDYTEFIAACMDLNKAASKGCLEAAFKTFDKDGSGTISMNEIKSVLGGAQAVGDEAWNEIVRQVDKNGDGIVDLREFMEMMTQSK